MRYPSIAVLFDRNRIRFTFSSHYRGIFCGHLASRTLTRQACLVEADLPSSVSSVGQG